MDLSVCYVGVTPSILTVSNGVGRSTTANIQRGADSKLCGFGISEIVWHLCLERLKFLSRTAGT